MTKSKNLIYVGSNPEGYINEDMMISIFEYLATHEIREKSKANPRKLGENYLLELEINEHTKQMLQNLKQMNKIKLYKRTHSWNDISKMYKVTNKSS